MFYTKNIEVVHHHKNSSFVEKKERNEKFCRSSRSYDFTAFWLDHAIVFRSIFFPFSKAIPFSVRYMENKKKRYFFFF